MNYFSEFKNLIETERLELRIIEEIMADRTLKYYEENNEHFLDSMPDPIEDPLTYRAQIRRLAFEYDMMMEGKLVRYYIFSKEDTELRDILGDIVFFNILRGSVSSCELGLKLAKNAQKKGFMSEALKVLIDYMFGEHKLHRIEANIKNDNIDSIKLVEKIGFRFEGNSFSYLRIRGKWEDHVRYSLINTEAE